METVPHPAQEGTSLSDRDTGVPLEVHNAPQCTAVNDILARVGDKWSVRVVMGLADGSRRFNELRRDIPGISQRMLTRTLRGLERDGPVWADLRVPSHCLLFFEFSCAHMITTYCSHGGTNHNFACETAT